MTSSNMGDRIRQSQARGEDKQTARQSASNREHSKAHPAKSYRLPPETLMQLEEIRVAEQQDTGRIPTTTEIVIRAIAELHHRAVKK